ncbi:hypothetical protein NL676_006132 [Syzygium grande]|nr:hypothetical protein NL676_006132 [Syzygium grande]
MKRFTDEIPKIEGKCKTRVSRVLPTKGDLRETKASMAVSRPLEAARGPLPISGRGIGIGGGGGDGRGLGVGEAGVARDGESNEGADRREPLVGLD